MQPLTVRRAGAEDAALLYELFAADRAAEFAPLGLAPAQLTPLIEMQYRGRQMEYAARYPGAADYILSLADGTAIGRHLISREPEGYRTVDICILPAYRNRRYGAWALRRLQLQAVREDVPCRLRVVKSNRARKLYERQGYRILAQDELSFEMEWSFSRHPDDLPHDELLDRIVLFLRGIGLTVDFGPTGGEVFLPGIRLQRNGLVIDRDNLLFPGDLLHEAGHLAVMPPEGRNSDSPDPIEQGEEIAATAWSYAAARHLGIPPTQVIHDNGFRGMAAGLRASLAQKGFGVPLLAWMGLCTQESYPAMTRWLREDAPETAAAALYEEAVAQ